METYIVYNRSVVASAIFFALYSFIAVVVFAFVMDYFPDADPENAALLFIALLFVSFILTQISSKGKARLIVSDDKVILHMIRDNLFVATPDTTIPFNSISQIGIRSGLVSGSYLLLQLDNGKKIKLYKKLHLLTNNKLFFEICTSLKTALDRYNQGAAATENNDANARKTLSYTPRELAWKPEDRKPFPVRYFKGNQFTCIAGAAMWGFTIIFPLAALATGDPLTAILLLSFLLVICVWPASTALNYFGVSPRHLVIRKHNLPWKHQSYYLKDITEVIFSKTGIGINRLTLHTVDMRANHYTAPSLSNKDWVALKKLLVNVGIKVRDEHNFIL